MVLNENENLCIELEQSKDIFHSIVEKSLDGIIIVDGKGVIKFTNKALCELFGKTKEELDGQLFGFPMVAGDSTEIDLLHHKKGLLTVEMRTAQSSWFGKNAYVAILRDISAHKATEAIIQNLAHHDQLTGLPNRRLFLDRLKISLGRAKRNSLELAVLYMDLDGFKAINDDFGHEFGDEVLKEVALRLVKIIRESDTVARIGGDEFIFIINDAPNYKNITSIAHKIISQVNHPIIFNNTELHVGCSIGISLFPQDGLDHNELMKNADSAMYQVKKSGKNACAFFDCNGDTLDLL